MDSTQMDSTQMDSMQAVGSLGALAHEIRLALFRMLVERGPDGLPAGAIAERLGVPPSSLSFHLHHLRRAGLITQRRRHRQLLYAAEYGAMDALLAYLTDNCCGRGTAAQARIGTCADDAAPILRRSG